MSEPTPASEQPPPLPQGDASAPPPAPLEASGVRCRKCGYELTGVVIGSKCPECGEPVTLSFQHAGQATPGAATASLVLGIVSIVTAVCCYGVPGLVCGPLAIYYARKTRQEIQDGQAPQSASGIVTAGFVCGIVGTVLSVLYIVGMVLYAILLGVMFAFAP